MFRATQVCILLSLLRLMHEPTSYSMHAKYVIFYMRTMRYSCILGDKYKFTANASKQGPQNHQNASFCCIVLTFECYIQHSNVATFEGSFECRTFVYALLWSLPLTTGSRFFCTPQIDFKLREHIFHIHLLV